MNSTVDFDLHQVVRANTTTLIEASAGTGKTTMIAALATLALAEGWCEIDQIMLVTFGRRAAGELRSSLHRRIGQTLRDLDDRHHHRRLATGDVIDDDARHRLLSGSDEQVMARRDRLRRARLDFDQATIATTHQFCHTMLAELGVLADFDPSAHFVDDPGELLAEVVNETFLRRYRRDREGVHRPYVSYVTELADKVAGGTAEIEAGSSTIGLDRAELAHDLRSGFEQLKWSNRTYDFDDMVVRLHQALDAGTSTVGREQLSAAVAAARTTLSDRFSLVMIDEYQDTDALQWQIVRAAFHHYSQVFLIGDPKQAIYAFRDADVYAYLSARQASDHHYSLRYNRRSSAQLVTQLNRLFEHRHLGRDIACPPAMGGRETEVTTTDGAPMDPLQVRLVVPTTGQHFREAGESWQAIRHDLARQVGSLLQQAQITDPGTGRPRLVQPADISVVVRANKRAEEVRATLAAAGIPVVFAGADSVFGSPSAIDWRALLEAITQPALPSLRRAALTDFFGFQPPSLAHASDDAVADIGLDLRRAARTLERAGVASMFAELTTLRTVAARVLGSADGERRWTDLRHLAELLHAEALSVASTCPPSGLARHLLRWLTERTSGKAVLDEQTRRLEADGGAVQVMTIHRSKGLSLPVVLLPDLTIGGWQNHKRRPLVINESGQPTLHVNPTAAQLERVLSDDADETLRLAYVAATRAQHLVRLWWCADPATEHSAINRLLIPPRNGEVPAGRAGASLESAQHLINHWHDQFGLEVVTADETDIARVPARTSITPDGARAFTRTIDHHWRRTSYSALTARAHGSTASDPDVSDEPELTPENELGDDVPPVIDTVTTTPSRWQHELTGLPGGVEFGSLVHEVLEQLDWQSETLIDDLTGLVSAALVDHPVPGVTVAPLVTGLAAVVSTPLGAIADDRCLSQVPISDRLAELEFELPLASSSSIAATLADLADLLADPGLVTADDPLHGYGAVLRDSPAATEVLSGWLTGSIDAVLRLTSPTGTRHLVVDYKTNRIWLPPEVELRVEDYTAEAMTQLMIEAHYPLQALLYCVALHRFLSWRQPGYDPEHHLGGVAYLFVRGMGGPVLPEDEPPEKEAPGNEPPVEGAPDSCAADSGARDKSAGEGGMPWGVFSWRPSVALVLACDRLLTPHRER